MNGKVIENVDTYKHLGLIRNSKSNDNAELTQKEYSWLEIQHTP